MNPQRFDERVEVVEIRVVQGEKPIKAFVDIKIGGWIIRDFRIIKQNGQRRFVSPPQVSWKDPESGQIKYRGLLTIPSEQKQAIDVAILSAFQKEMESRDARK